MDKTKRLLLLVTGFLLATCRADMQQSREVSYTRSEIMVGEGPSAVAAGDIDNDGHQDLAVANELSFDLSIYRGDGRGGLISMGRVPAGENPTDLALTDLDGDGSLDIVVANHDTDYLTTLLGDGMGGFEPAANSPLRIDVQPHPHAVRAVDIDLDGHVDLLVDHRAGEGLLILRGMGGGVFETPGMLIDVGGDPYLGMAVGDVNRDGQVDLVTPNPREVAVWLMREPGQLEFVRANSLAAAPFAVALGDFNGDDKPDIVAASDEGSPLIHIFLGDGHGDFLEAKDSPFEMAPGGKYITVGDFNGDGVDDAAIASYHSTDVLLLLGDIQSIQMTFLPGGEHPWGLAAADLNEDRVDDLVILDNTSTMAAVYLSTDE